MRVFPPNPEPVELLGYVHQKEFGQTVLTLFKGKLSVDIVIGRHWSYAEFFGIEDDCTPYQCINLLYVDKTYEYLKEFLSNGQG